MLWHEKIAIIKETYSQEAFLASRVGFKKIKKTIESKFIVRPKDYYHPNIYLGAFRDWWKHMDKTYEAIIPYRFDKFIDTFLYSQHQFWVGYELGEVVLYKATPKVIKHLSTIGQTWTRTFFIIHQKYDFIIGLNIRHDGTHIIYAGTDKMKQRLKNQFD
ncbi:MAG: hypothetical protein AB8G11_05600 [Saprospiraceae bacterium]